MHSSRRVISVAMLVCVCALAALVHSSVAVGATELLRAVRPPPMKNEFNYQSDTGRIYSEPSLFGLPNYQADIVGRLSIPLEANANGCAEYQPGFTPDEPSGKQAPVIALVERGGCSFGTKALNAQKAGASAIVVFTTSTGVQYPLPKMAGGDDTLSINIPGMLINYENGQTLLGHVNEWRAANNMTGKGFDPTNTYYQGAWLSLHYSLIAPDDRVEWDLFTYPDEVNAAPFLAAFKPAAEALGNRAMFTPHYRIVDGDSHGCTLNEGEECSEANKEALPCGSQCSNCGRYCRLDPNGDLDTPPDGADAVTESTVQKCLWHWGQQNAQPLLWWRYIAARQASKCGESTTPKECSAAAMAAAGVPAAARTFVESCRGNTDPYANEENDLLEDELQWQSDWQPLTSPYMFVNNFTYYGGFSCADPINVATCGPLSMMCMGFLPGTQPAICTANGCEPGVSRDACGVCGGTATNAKKCGAGKSASFPVGAVIGIIILCCVLIGGGVYFYMRRQNLRMRDEVNDLLAQFLPLDGAAGIGNTQPNGKQKPRDTTSNLRLIGNLDSAGDEPTDL